MSQEERYPRLVYGLCMAGVTALLWGFLPIVLKVVLQNFSPLFLGWFRLTFAFFTIIPILAWKGKKPLSLLRRPPPLAILAAVFLAWNYYTYSYGVHISGASSAQVLIQVGALALVLFGVFFFRERLSKRQVLGMVLTFLGLFLFARARNWASQTFNYGDWIIFSSGISWAIYAAIQKQLSDKYDPQNLNMIVFGASALMMLFVTDLGEIYYFSDFWWLLIVLILGLITLFAYMSLAEALTHAPASRVSMILTLNPLLTLLGMYGVQFFQVSWVAPEPLSMLGYFGAFLVMGGVALVIFKKNN